MSERACHWCGSASRELRPYGPGGTWVCVPCVKADPDREEQAFGAFAAQLEAAAAVSRVVLLGPEGPTPVVIEQEDADGLG